MRIKLFFVHGCVPLLCSDTVIRNAVENVELFRRVDEQRWRRMDGGLRWCVWERSGEVPEVKTDLK